MRLQADEPAAGPWRVKPLDALLRLLLAAGGDAPGRPRVVAVDGRSAAGKTSVAERLRAAAPGAAVVHTDDVAWYESFFGWTELLVRGVLEPLHAGRAVAYRPPAWEARGRRGAIAVPAGCPLVLLEGVGAGRRELARWVDALVWMQSDLEQARERGIARDGGNRAAAEFWREWEAQEVPFLADHRPWERADVCVAGTPVLPHDPATEVVLAPAPRRERAQHPTAGAASRQRRRAR